MPAHLQANPPESPGRAAADDAPIRLLITAGPTHEPIDAVRYIANRSSGRMGIALAEAAADAGWPVTLLLGPTPRQCTHPGVTLVRYQTTAELEAELARHLPQHDALVMGAAVADYRPRHDHGDGKLRRERDGLVLELESTPDLLAGCSAARQRDGRVDDLLLVGFALEPREALLDSAAAKLRRKGVDAIVANPLETMDGDTIDAILLDADGTQTATPGVLSKPDFARWLLERLRERVRAASA